MCARTMLTEFNFQSSTHVKMPSYSIIFMQYFIRLPCMHVALFCPLKCMLKFPYLNYLKSLTSQFSTSLLARRNLCTAPGKVV